MNRLVVIILTILILTIDQQGGSGHLIASVFVCQCGGLLNRREVFGCGWGVHMSYLHAGGRRGVDVAFSWKEEEKVLRRKPV